jgi:hypothetical protein
MAVAFRMKAYPGWVVLVIVCKHDRDNEVADRRRVELVDEK